MRYNNFKKCEILEFERVSPSGAVRKYKVIPAEGNRVAIILHLDLIPKVNTWTRDAWEVTSFESELEFHTRCGEELSDVIMDNLASHGVVVEEDEEEDVWEAKFRFVQNLNRLAGTMDELTGLIDVDEARAYYEKEVNQKYNAFISVNTEYVRRILAAAKPCIQFGHHSIVQMTFKVATMDDGWKYHNKPHFALEVNKFVMALEVFLNCASIAADQESALTIQAFMAAHNNCHEAIKNFGLFEQG